MSNQRKITFLVAATLAVFSCVRNAQAVHMYDSGTVNNTYLFIENNVDNEYFITPSATDPRFTGANVWTKYKTNQDSLGYMGYAGWARNNSYIDMWIEDSPINMPFNGIRCRIANGQKCPSTGYVAAAASDNNGFYHTRSGTSTYDGSYAFASLSPTAYEYFKNQSAGNKDNFILNFCFNDKDYDYGAGERCNTLSTGYWYKLKFNVTKIGHLKLRSTGALAEVWTASDGTPSVTIGTDTCQTGVVAGKNGLICKMVSYSLEETTRLNALNFKLIVDKTKLGFTPAYNEIKYSGDAVKWTNYNTSTDYYNVFNTSGDYVYLFFQDTFFKKLVNAGKSITANDDIFTFNFQNAAVPESGYYQFTTSTTLNIIPKEYGISIISSDQMANPKRTGKIGSEQPIAFDYQITTSAPRQADSITVQVVGNSAKVNGRPYCVFTSADNTLKVPIPAYISFTTTEGATVTKRNSCSEAPVDITKASWVQTAWNANIDDSFYYKTNLKLLFPMDDGRSHFTVSGQEWMGTVSASGEIKATATWVGVGR
ncbi:fimbrial protein [Leclercia adecarboxylata]|uniref:fimbrial protein n=1 Tax=Leclercia adecarboxylata TaxID=83655 RepID=UPI00111A3F15|nr:fimbrial protein [Leclercia adecarboxylata]QCZ25830.1 fimbrial protein [Leclercia adecarboxylata]